MRYNFLAILLLLAVTQTHAKDTGTDSSTATIAPVKPVVAWFEVEHQNYYQVSKVPPLSDVEFYSERGGGRLLKKVTADNLGIVLQTGDVAFKPAFALSRSKKNAKNILGSGMTGFVGAKEFTLCDVSCAGAGKNVTVYWQGTVYTDAPVVFEVLKSKSNAAPAIVATYKASGIGTAQYYSYNDVMDEADKRYYIKVINTEAGDRYTTPPLAADGNVASTIQVYPTVTTGPLNIVVLANNNATTYHIADMLGKIVADGILHSGKNTISVSNIAPGNYLVYTQNSTPVKIVKQ